MSAEMLISIVFYVLIALITIYLAGKVKTAVAYGQGKEKKTAYTSYTTDGERTRRSFYNRFYLVGIFLILFLCSALRFGIGNDYKQYTQTAHEAYVGGYVVTEVGFNWLVNILYTLSGGEYYELVFAVFAFATLVIFLKACYEQSEDFAITYFLFMTLGLYFQTYNTVRYYLALAIALYAMRYVLNKDFIKFVFWILLASLFHKSVLLTIPVYWGASYVWKRWMIVAGIFFSAGCFLAKSVILKIALLFYPSYENTVFLEGGTSPSSILRGLLVLGLYVWYRKRYLTETEDKELCFYMQLNLLSVVVCVFFSFLPVVTRIAYYFSVTQLLMIPKMICGINEEGVRKKVKLFVTIICVIYFVIFLVGANKPGVGLLPYRSWLFEVERYTYK